MTTRPTLAIEASGLVKSFGDTKAVDGMHLEPDPAAIFAPLTTMLYRRA